MRSDHEGLMWNEVSVPTGGMKGTRLQPPIPETDWTIPTDFPNLSAAKALSIDVETYDPELTTHGPGWARGVGHLVGMSVGTEDGHNWYFPMRHEIEPENNMDPQHVLNWANDSFNNKRQPKVGANIAYDIGWLRQEGVTVKGQLYDVQFAEALLDEHARSYSLEKLAQKYLSEGKQSNSLYEWCALFYGGSEDGKQRANIYRAPARLVGPYAESDADLPMRIYMLQHTALHNQGLIELLEMECALIPMLIDMRFKGVRVDVDKAEQSREALLKEQELAQAELDKASGCTVEVNSNMSIAAAFDEENIEYPLTDKGAPSFRKEWLTKHPSNIARLITKIRTLAKARSTFVENYILEKNVDGRLHCQFNSLRNDLGGTVSGRFSSSMPNLQNIPSRDPVMGPLVRGLFVPDHGCDTWVKVDYSQIELRLFAHYAQDPYIVEAYKNGTDFHTMTGDLLGGKVPRAVIKTLNFLLLYGGGKAALATQLAQLFTPTEARTLLKELK